MRPRGVDRVRPRVIVTARGPRRVKNRPRRSSVPASPFSIAAPGLGMSAKAGTRHGSNSPARSASHGPALREGDAMRGVVDRLADGSRATPRVRRSPCDREAPTVRRRLRRRQFQHLHRRRCTAGSLRPARQSRRRRMKVDPERLRSSSNVVSSREAEQYTFALDSARQFDRPDVPAVRERPACSHGSPISCSVTPKSS